MIYEKLYLRLNILTLSIQLCFIVLFFQKISAISVMNARTIPTPITTYTPSILGKAIRFWDNAEKQKGKEIKICVCREQSA